MPFIARYRKEQTGNLDEVAIQSVLDAKETWDAVVHRKTFIVEEIDRQGKLTPELKERILATFELERLEDLYLPYKPKRKTKAMAAREAGLEPLAEWMWERLARRRWRTRRPSRRRRPGSCRRRRASRRRERRSRAARDILVERLSEDADLRERVRSAFFERGYVRTRKKGEKAKPNSRFEHYFAYQERVSELLRARGVAPLPGHAPRLDGGGAACSSLGGAARRRGRSTPSSLPRFERAACRAPPRRRAEC